MSTPLPQNRAPQKKKQEDFSQELKACTHTRSKLFKKHKSRHFRPQPRLVRSLSPLSPTPPLRSTPVPHASHSLSSNCRLKTLVGFFQTPQQHTKPRRRTRVLDGYQAGTHGIYGLLVLNMSMYQLVYLNVDTRPISMVTWTWKFRVQVTFSPKKAPVQQKITKNDISSLPL